MLKPKPWGSENLEPYYLTGGQKIGEVWFEAQLPLLVKLLFTTDRLSIQVHPEDEYARQHENSRGKTEMWHILRAEPGARIGLGLRETITPRKLREAALSGEIAELMNWVEARAGDTFFTPARTIHAIGGGLTLCEIQQYSDVTYRIYDYGSGRELHLDKAIEVADTRATEAKPAGLPVECRYFHTRELRVQGRTEYHPGEDGFALLIFHRGEGRIAGEPYRAGETWLVAAGSEPFAIEPHSETGALETTMPPSEAR